MLRFLTILLALCLLHPLAAEARVGVTSATDGDPLGKPPTAPERILRIGIDVQADEAITTGAKDRAHLVFLDGTSLTVGPDARLVIDKFVYDPATKTGELAVNLGKGVLRLVGGRISKKEPIVVTTPSSTIGVRGGICLFEVSPDRTVSTFAFGTSMTVTGQGRAETATRPGSQVTTRFGKAPDVPILAPPGSLEGEMGQLEGGRDSHGNHAAPGGATASSSVILTGMRALAAQPEQHAPTTVRKETHLYENARQWTTANILNPTVLNPATYASPDGHLLLPNRGTATYTGSFAGADSTGGSFGGAFSMGWSFASQTGSFSATGTGTHGGNATAPLALIRGTTVFTGPLTVTNLGGGNTGTGTIAGTFVRQSGSPVGGVVGGFTGTTNTASTFAGAFAGHR